MTENGKQLEAVKAAIDRAGNVSDLEVLRIKYLGRKGIITDELKGVGSLPPQQRAKAGTLANRKKNQIEDWLKQAEARLISERIKREEQDEILDLTAPAIDRLGHLHPVSRLYREVIQIFWQLGFSVAEGPEIETEWYNFEALNIGKDHPARDMQDTFYLDGDPSKDGLPRTHTSNVQVRYMEKHHPPIRIVAPGKVYRNEDEDPKHVWIFNQIEGLVIDENIGIGDLKGTLLAVVRGVLGEKAKIRLRPSYFPYTEPSIEVDASCVVCHGKGCATCAGTGWIELLGSGMVHPQVLRNVGVDPEIYSGFAFGLGFERLAAVKYGIDDLRYLWRPNLKFLEQFS